METQRRYPPLLLALFFTLCMFTIRPAMAQHTFSIVAVDTVTGEVGSAGASCISGFPVNIIAYVLPGTGAINTQAWWQFPNKNYGTQLMLAGHSPQQIIDSLSTNDKGTDGRNEQWRQYGGVDLFSGGARAAAWTGDSADSWKGHIIGPNYAIQGNILIGSHVLDSMEARFLNTPGELADKLMAAMQGANIPGADARCLGDSTSSTSSYLQVAKPNDSPGNFYLNLSIPPLPAGIEPIDSLQSQFDDWKLSTGTANPQPKLRVKVYPNPAGQVLRIGKMDKRGENLMFSLFNIHGEQVTPNHSLASGNIEIDVADLARGIYLFQISQNGRVVQSGKVQLR